MGSIKMMPIFAILLSKLGYAALILLQAWCAASKRELVSFLVNR